MCPVVALDHIRQDQPRHVQQAFDVGVDHLIPIVGLGGPGGIGAFGQAGVVDEDRDVGDERSFLFKGGFALGQIADVENERFDERFMFGDELFF